MLALKLLAVLKDLGFTDSEIVAFCTSADTQDRMERGLFKALYGGPYTSSHERSEWAQELPAGAFSTDIHWRLTNACLGTVGILQMLSERELLSVPGIGKKTVEAIKLYFGSDLRLRRTDETVKDRAIEIFKNPNLIPIDYLQAKTGISMMLLRQRGMRQLSHLTMVPKSRLLAIPANDPYKLTRGAVDTLQVELNLLGLDFVKKR